MGDLKVCKGARIAIYTRRRRHSQEQQARRGRLASEGERRSPVGGSRKRPCGACPTWQIRAVGSGDRRVESAGGGAPLWVKPDAALIQIVTWVMGWTDGLLYEPLVIYSLTKLPPSFSPHPTLITPHVLYPI